MKTTISSGQLQSMLRLLDDKGMTPERFTEILSTGILADVFDPNADLNNRFGVRELFGLGSVMSEVFYLSVDYNKTLEQMIRDGHYGQEDKRITEKLFPIPVTKKGVVTFEARYFFSNHLYEYLDYGVLQICLLRGRILTADTKNPWRPAGIEHLLALGSFFPKEQLKHEISSIDLIVKGDDNSPLVPRLYSEKLNGKRTRTLSLKLTGYFFPADYVLAVRPIRRV